MQKKARTLRSFEKNGCLSLVFDRFSLFSPLLCHCPRVNLSRRSFAPSLFTLSLFFKEWRERFPNSCSWKRVNCFFALLLFCSFALSLFRSFAHKRRAICTKNKRAKMFNPGKLDRQTDWWTKNSLNKIYFLAVLAVRSFFPISRGKRSNKDCWSIFT